MFGEQLESTKKELGMETDDKEMLMDKYHNRMAELSTVVTA